jgi:UDP-glucuronate 4-epimerase
MKNKVKEVILITGGAGFIGSHLIERFLDEGYRIICLDNFNNYYDPELKEKNISNFLKNQNLKLIRGDILDVSLLHRIFSGKYFLNENISNLTPNNQNLKPNKVIHLAAMAGVRASIVSPDIYIDVDVKGTLNLLEMSRIYEIKQFIFASSSSVYGINKKIPFSEDDPVELQISPYAAAKKSAELLCKTYHHLYNIKITILRLFTIYGPRQRPDMAIRKFTDLIFKGKQITMFGDGTSKRDYTYVSDCIDGFIASVKKPMDFEVFNIGSGKIIKLKKLIDLIGKLSGKEIKIESLCNQKGDVPVTFADIKKAKSLLGYSPKVKIENGINKFIKWYKKEYS